MKLEDIRVLVENSVRTEILHQINEQTEIQQVEESFGGVVLGLVSAATFAMASNFVLKKMAGIDNKKELERFVADNIPNHEKDVERMVRRLKYVRSLEDVDKIEYDIEQYVRKLDGLQSKVASYQYKEVEGEKVKNVLRKVNNYTLKKSLEDYIEVISRAFKIEIDETRAMIDSRNF